MGVGGIDDDQAPGRVRSSVRPEWSDDDHAELVAHVAGLEAVIGCFGESLDRLIVEHPVLAQQIDAYLPPGEHHRLVAEHLRALLNDPRDSTSVSASARVGYAHIRASVAPSAYLSSYNLVFPCFHRAEAEAELVLPALGSFRRRWLHDVCATLDSYHDALASTWDSERARLKSSLVEIETQATTDVLTGVLRRDAFVRAVQSSRRSGLLMIIDLDDFKRLNDRAGHLAGDEALSEIGAALNDNVRNQDAVGRLGGDEFAIWI